MTIYTPITDKELSQRKLQAYEDMAKIINWGRRNPVRFASHFFGLALLDYQ
jgi:hypothetical protein